MNWMPDRVHQNPSLIYTVGTQVVTLRDVTMNDLLVRLRLAHREN
jgi:hypothetical protein